MPSKQNTQKQQDAQQFLIDMLADDHFGEQLAKSAADGDIPRLKDLVAKKLQGLDPTALSNAVTQLSASHLDLWVGRYETQIEIQGNWQDAGYLSISKTQSVALTLDVLQSAGRPITNNVLNGATFEDNTLSWAFIEGAHHNNTAGHITFTDGIHEGATPQDTFSGTLRLLVDPADHYKVTTSGELWEHLPETYQGQFTDFGLGELTEDILIQLIKAAESKSPTPEEGEDFFDHVLVVTGPIKGTKGYFPRARMARLAEARPTDPYGFKGKIPKEEHTCSSGEETNIWEIIGKIETALSLCALVAMAIKKCIDRYRARMARYRIAPAQEQEMIQLGHEQAQEIGEAAQEEAVADDEEDLGEGMEAVEENLELEAPVASGAEVVAAESAEQAVIEGEAESELAEDVVEVAEETI
ncbi:MAG: hypothetical protein QNJ97_01110 [Myxococcota bacterium]|nr:hypothetical protein [Myxococcota bacterium]